MTAYLMPYFLFNLQIAKLYLPKKKSITDKLSIEANSMDPEQTSPIEAVWFGSTLFAIEAS